jgi:hypothetical protein
LRHVELLGTSLPSATQARLTTAMLAWLTTNPAPQGRTAEGHAWMQRRAIDILAAMHHPGDNNQVFAAIYARFADRNAPLSLRCTAAEALGKLDYRGAVNVSGAELVASFLDFATRVCQDEWTRVDQELTAAKAAREKDATAHGEPLVSVPTLVQEPLLPSFEVDRTRRRIIYQLHCLQTGLQGDGANNRQGVMALAGSDTATAQKVAQQVAQIMTSVEKGIDLESMALDIKRGAAALQQLAPANPTKAPATVPAPVEPVPVAPAPTSPPATTPPPAALEDPLGNSGNS